MKADFDAWLTNREPPKDYQKAFFGFVKRRYHKLAA
jgi:hypothetical protein